MTTQQLQETLQRHLGYLQQDKNNVTLLMTISDYYRQLKDWGSAQQYLDTAKQFSKQTYWAYQGLLYLDAGELNLAKEAFIQALAEEDTPANRYQLAYCFYLNREFSLALNTLNSPQQSSVDCSSELLKAKILHHLQRSDEAISLLEQLIIHHDANAELAGLLALLYFDTNELEQAKLVSNKALALNAENSEGQLVRLLLKTLKNEVSLEEIETLLLRIPDECRLWFALGATQLRHLNFFAAERAFSRATELWPSFYDSWINSGWCHLLQDNLDKSEKAYQQAVVIDAERAEGWGGLALVNALRANMVEAKKWLKKTRELDSGCFLVTLTQLIIANQENPEQAQELFDRALPKISAEIDRMLSATVLSIRPGDKVIH